MVAITKLANRLISLYDANRDGQIELNGVKRESERLQREVHSSFDHDIITLSRYSHDKLFQAADTDQNGKVTRAEMSQLLQLFDTNNDGELTNKGPFWNPKGELRNFERKYPEKQEILEQYFVPRPQPHYPHYPHHPHYPRRMEAMYATAGSSVGIRIG